MSAPEPMPDGLKMVTDCFGIVVRLTEERMAHILEHPEMKEMGAEIDRLLAGPQIVRRSRSDEAVRLFYGFYPQTIVGAKWLCIVVKYTGNDAFLITAYLTDQPKLGEPLWPISQKSGLILRQISWKCGSRKLLVTPKKPTMMP